MGRIREQSARRRELVLAAGRAVGARGVRGLRIKDVATEAHVSAGLVSYYYPDLAELLVALHEYSVDRFYWSRMQLIDGVVSGRDRLLVLARSGIPDRDDEQLSLTLYELHLHAARDRTHAALMTSLFDREVSLYAMVLGQGGSSGEFRLRGSALDIATNAVALEDAYGLHLVARNTTVDAARARQLLLGFLSEATGTDLTGTVRHG